MNKGRGIFQGLDQIWFDGIFKQQGHGAGSFRSAAVTALPSVL